MSITFGPFQILCYFSNRQKHYSVVVFHSGQQQAPGPKVPGDLPPHMAPPYTNSNNFSPIANTFPHSTATMPRYPMQSPRHMYPNGGGQAANMQPMPQQPQYAGPNGVASPK